MNHPISIALGESDNQTTKLRLYDRNECGLYTVEHDGRAIGFARSVREALLMPELEEATSGRHRERLAELRAGLVSP